MNKLEEWELARVDWQANLITALAEWYKAAGTE